MMRATIIVFAKAPVAGHVKTRLANDIGTGRAAALFRIMMKRTIDEALATQMRVVIAVDPASALTGWKTIFPPHLARLNQGGGDLGTRMASIMARVQHGPVIIIGADAPGLRARHLHRARQRLEGTDAVFGPAADGGYWLIGLARRRPAPEMFRGVRWSTQHALADTVASLPASFQIEQLNTLSDIDHGRDLVHFKLRTTAR